MDEDFKDKFFNLEGVHYNERKKNFYKLLYSTDPEVLVVNLDIQPRNYLENIFYVDVLIHTKQVDKLLGILKEGSGVLTSRILKQKWFFQEAFKNLSEAAIVNEFLPTLSYSLRMKILKKMSLLFDEHRMDNIFDHVLQRYGLFTAQQFLFSCSSSKIINILNNNKVTLSVEQLKRILDKDFNLVKIYLDEYQKNTGQPFDNYSFLSYIPWKYPYLYFEFQPYYRDFVKIGRQTTKAVLKINSNEALKDVQEIEQKFNTSAVTRKVMDFDKNYLSKNFPAKISQTNWMTIANYLEKYPKKKRWQVFSRAFTQAYNEDPINHLKIISENVIEMFPNDIKEKWAEIQFRETNNCTYFKFFDAKKAFLMVKERINITSVLKDRTSMLKDLIKICYKNKDYDSYEEVLKYIIARHRNEDNYQRYVLMNEIFKNIDFECSTETFWNYLNLMIDIFRVKGEFLPWANVSQYLIFVVKRNLPLDEPVAQYVKDTAAQLDGFHQFCHFHNVPKIHGVIMRRISKFLHTIEPESKQQSLTISLMTEIVEFNENHPEFLIDLNDCPVIVELVKNVLAREHISYKEEVCVSNLVQYNYSKKYKTALKIYEESKLLEIVKTLSLKEDNRYRWAAVFRSVLTQPRTTEFLHGLLDFYFTQFMSDQSDEHHKNTLNYFIVKEPQVIVKYFDKILSGETRGRLSLNYKLMKLYSHLAFDEKLLTCFKLILATSRGRTKTELISLMAKVMPTSDFIHLAQQYIPQKGKLIMENSDQKRLYETRCAIAKSLKNLDEYVKLIPLLGPFCQGDYLQSSLPLLYKVMYNVSEQQASPFINVLTQRAVSARKHAVFLSFEVLPQKNALEVFNIVSTKQNDASAQKYIFRTVLKYFLKNPSEQLLERVLTHMTFVQKDDQESVQKLLDSINKVPIKFRPVFVEQLWNFLDVIEKQEVRVLEYRSTLLDTINSYDVAFFSAIQESFCRNVIKNHFFSNEDFMLKSGKAYDFAAKYLLAHTDEDHFKFLFDILRDNKNLNNGIIYKFFEQVYKKYIKQEVEFLKFFKIHWEQLFTDEESFSEYVLLRLMVLYNETSNIGEFAKSVSKSFEDIINEYGPYVKDILYDCIVTFFSVDNEIDDKIIFALELLNLKSEINCFIASNLAVGYKCDDDGYFRVINALKTVDSAAVRIRCNDMLKWYDWLTILFEHN